jgi:hypothetical protein
MRTALSALIVAFCREKPARELFRDDSPEPISIRQRSPNGSATYRFLRNCTATDCCDRASIRSLSVHLSSTRRARFPTIASS